MILSGSEIKNNILNGKIQIEDFDESRLGPNSYNLRLGAAMMIYDETVLDAKQENTVVKFLVPENGVILYPGMLYLGQTMEYTRTDGFVPMLEGRSSVGRLGINIHATAGFGDVGFAGRWTLELSCVQPVRVYAGMEICQIYYHTVQGDTDRIYRGKYQCSECVSPSMMWMELNISPV